MNIHNINIGDKFVTVKKVWFLDVETVITVTDVDADGIVSFVFGENNSSTGYMDIETFREHFERVECMTNELEIELVEEIMENSEFEIYSAFDKCVVVSCKLPNGFVIVESYVFENAEDYDEDDGADICFDKIATKIWELEAYRRQQETYEAKMRECDCACDECCSECTDNTFNTFNASFEDMCLYTDLDCDDCNNYYCPSNTNNINTNKQRYID